MLFDSLNMRSFDIFFLIAEILILLSPIMMNDCNAIHQTTCFTAVAETSVNVYYSFAKNVIRTIRQLVKTVPTAWQIIFFSPHANYLIGITR